MMTVKKDFEDHIRETYAELRRYRERSVTDEEYYKLVDHYTRDVQEYLHVYGEVPDLCNE